MMEVIDGDGETLLNVVRSKCKMSVPPNEALDMSGSPHLIIGYLLKSELKNLKSKSYNWIGNMRG